MKRSVLILIVLLLTAEAQTQGVDRFIDSVSYNHPQIAALTMLTDVSVAGLKAGIYPSNPEVNVGYYPGKPSSIGNKTTWSVVQSFDFPSTYARIREIRHTDLRLAKLEEGKMVLQILENARASAIAYISMQKRLRILNGRLDEIEELNEAYRKMYEEGEVTVLDFNRISMERVATLSAVNELKTEISSAIAELDYLSGGNASLLTGSEYPLFTEPAIDLILGEKRRYHPSFLIPEMRVERAEKEISLSKSGNLPGFSVGYASESVGSEIFIGPQLGLTLPLWENSSRVKTGRASRLYEESYARAEIEALTSSIISQVNGSGSVKENLEMVNSIVLNTEAKELLNKALESGEISLSSYLISLREYYNIEDLALDLTTSYYLMLSKIWDYKYGGIIRDIN